MDFTKTISLKTYNSTHEINLPASKSISNRALILNAMSYSPYEIENLSDCDDTRVMSDAFNSNNNYFDMGAAGTSMRFLTAFLSKTVGEWVITGSERMKLRPIKLLVDALNLLGGKIEYMEKEGFPPLKIYGCAITGGKIDLDAGVSSQYISALMMIAPYMYKGLRINLKGNVISKPYIRMTQKMMAEFGVKAVFRGNTIDIKPQTYRPVRFRVEPDWSAASYWYELVSISGKGNIILKGLNKDSLQGDSAVAGIYKYLGVKTEYVENGVILKASPEAVSISREVFRHDFTDTPDLAQAVVVTCCLKNIPFCFSGLQSLKIKETDRIAALVTELAKLGYILREPVCGELAWNGEKTAPEASPVIQTYEDHRMAMAFAPAGIICPVTIQNPEVVNKSYPAFWDDLDAYSRAFTSGFA